jgi:hypothetical protein
MMQAHYNLDAAENEKKEHKTCKQECPKEYVLDWPWHLFASSTFR